MTIPPPIPPRFYAFWAINGPLDPARLRRQIDQFAAIGLDGVVFHPRFYPNDPPYLGEIYLAMVSDAILHAKSLGLRFWIYDEDGWPSGTVGGKLLEQYPEDAQYWVGLETEQPEKSILEFEREGTTWHLIQRKSHGVDYLNPDLAKHFLELTHERYRLGLAPEAFEHVETIFCDEPEFGLGHAFEALPPDGAIPWTPRLPELYHARHGEELIPLLPLLFFPSEGAEKVRIRFWELVTDVFCEAFLAPINDWCERHGKLFTAHVKGEEHPLFQVPTSGSCHQVFQHLGLPGIDGLERYPSNNFFPRQVSAAARQFGSGRSMAEAWGGSGWGGTPRDLEEYLLWLGKHGVTDFVLHVSQYRLDSAAMYDWPPSQPLHLTWTNVYPQVIDRVRRELTEYPRPPADTLVVAPYRGIMATFTPSEFLEMNVHDAGTYADTPAGQINTTFMELIENLHAAGVAYDVSDERSLEEKATFQEGEVRLGHCAYRRVIVAEGCRIESSIAVSIEKLAVHPSEILPVAAEEIPQEITGEVESLETIPLQWELEKSPMNTLPLEANALDKGWFKASFTSEMTGTEGASLELLFADEIAEIILNEEPLSPEPTEEGSRAVVLGHLVQASNTLLFLPKARVRRPFAWLNGFFRVVSGNVFRDGPSNTIKTAGPFALHDASTVVQSDLIADGFPFLRAPLVAKTVINLPWQAYSLRLTGEVADALKLGIDGNETGWTWQVETEYEFPYPLASGAHEMRIELIPNGYNSYGPHHYYGGDWFVVSPDQIKGVRNFADPEDAPRETHVTDWHFRRFGLPLAVLAKIGAG